MFYSYYYLRVVAVQKRIESPSHNLNFLASKGSEHIALSDLVLSSQCELFAICLSDSFTSIVGTFGFLALTKTRFNRFNTFINISQTCFFHRFLSYTTICGYTVFNHLFDMSKSKGGNQNQCGAPLLFGQHIIWHTFAKSFDRLTYTYHNYKYCDNCTNISPACGL